MCCRLMGERMILMLRMCTDFLKGTAAGYFANRGRSDTLAPNTIPERYLSYVNAVNYVH